MSRADEAICWFGEDTRKRTGARVNPNQTNGARLYWLGTRDDEVDAIHCSQLADWFMILTDFPLRETGTIWIVDTAHYMYVMKLQQLSSARLLHALPDPSSKRSDDI